MGVNPKVIKDTKELHKYKKVVFQNVLIITLKNPNKLTQK